MNALITLQTLGQSIWLDSISRSLLDKGELARLVDDDGVRGVTSNPSIFQKAIGEGVEYRAFLAELRAKDPAASALRLYEAIAIRDIQDAASVLRPVYERTKARDGYVSLEVTLVSGDTKGEILREARHLWTSVARPNVMIKVPGTTAGIEAFEELIASGINVNVTLLFSVETYARVAAAYLAGLEALSRRGADLSRVASVASFFVSRIDTAIDKEIEARIQAAKSPRERFLLHSLLGKAAIANAKLAYAHYQSVFTSARWRALAEKGAQVQRVLWASTGTKNKSYSDVMYVEELIGPDTVNTAPPATVDAFRDHGRPRTTLTVDVDFARDVIATLESLSISMKSVTDRLLEEGLKLFGDAFDQLIKAIEESARASAPFARATFTVPDALRASVSRELEQWTSDGRTRRLWDRDARLWTGADEGKWLGWLDAPGYAKTQVNALKTFAAGLQRDGFRHVLLLGMGGSSLCPEVLKLTFGSAPDHPTLDVLDSTDPAQIQTIEKRVDLSRTLCIVASKSGSTLEPAIFEQYFWDRVVKVAGPSAAARQFVAITDPGSKLEALAKEKGYRQIFAGVPSIGGRFSALSNFGLVPAALIGVDLARFTERAHDMARACEEQDAAKNPGVLLGILLGTAAKHGRDKLTLVVSPELASLGAWLEQLIAESTGKFGKGIIPIDLEPLASPSTYGEDRVFVYVRSSSAPDRRQDEAADKLERAGHAVVRIPIADKLDLGAEFFRWEFATAVIGSILGIHPFDQPDVEASKVATRALTSEYEKAGSLPVEKPFAAEHDLELYADARNAALLSKGIERGAGIDAYLSALLSQLKRGDYFAVLAYVEMNRAHAAELETLRKSVRDARHVATCVGFGPRFLHSTGQAYKGGPNTGVFLQITSADAADLAVPGQKYTFGVVKAAQARGDFQVLAERGRRALRVHIKGDVQRGFARLRDAVARALAEHAQLSS